jgi:hypothetical protein
VITAHETTIYLDQEFYPLPLLQRVVSDFSEYLSANLTPSGTVIQLDITVAPHREEDSPIVIHEFLNYVLDLTLKARFADSNDSEDDD